MRHVTVLLLVLTPLLFACAAEADPVTKDIDRALALAVGAMRAERDAADVVVTGARREILDGEYVWLVDFKLRKLLPEDPATGIVGLGGEAFVTVGLETGNVTIRRGE